MGRDFEPEDDQGTDEQLESLVDNILNNKKKTDKKFGNNPPKRDLHR